MNDTQENHENQETHELFDAEPVWVAVTSAHWGMRLDAFLALCRPEHSRTKWQAILEQGQCVTLWPSQGIPVGKYRLNEDVTDIVIHHQDPWPVSSALMPHPMNLRIYYEDDDIGVIEKPAGLVVHPGNGTGDQPTLVHGLLALWNTLSVCGGGHKPGLVHRLDKETSGLMVVAKHDRAHRLLNQAFALRQVDKRYWAFVWGHPNPHFGRIHTGIGRHPTIRTQQAVIHGGGGREAITTYRVVRRNQGMSVLTCGLHTGRTHQIRVHCAYIGHPIVGDGTYGRSLGSGATVPPSGHSGHGLHAYHLAFAHPMTQEALAFHSPLPPYWQTLWDDMSPLDHRAQHMTHNIHHQPYHHDP